MEAAAPKSPAEFVPSISKETDLFCPFDITIYASNLVLSLTFTSLKRILEYFSMRRRPNAL